MRIPLRPAEASHKQNAAGTVVADEKDEGVVGAEFGRHRLGRWPAQTNSYSRGCCGFGSLFIDTNECLMNCALQEQLITAIHAR